MTYGVDTGMQGIQPANVDPPLDPPSAEAQFQQLLSSDNPVLPLRQLSDRRLIGPSLLASPRQYTYMGH